MFTNLVVMNVYNKSKEFEVSVYEWKYLGMTIVGGHTFFRATNSVLNILAGAHEHTLVSPLYMNCVPILTYGCGVKEYQVQEV